MGMLTCGHLPGQGLAGLIWPGTSPSSPPGHLSLHLPMWQLLLGKLRHRAGCNMVTTKWEVFPRSAACCAAPAQCQPWEGSRGQDRHCTQLALSHPGVPSVSPAAAHLQLPTKPFASSTLKVHVSCVELLGGLGWQGTPQPVAWPHGAGWPVRGHRALALMLERCCEAKLVAAWEVLCGNRLTPGK